MYKTLFELIFNTEQLFANPIYDYILVTVLTILFFGIAFKAVGALYNLNIISGSDAGSFFHWGIRLGLVYLCIQVLIFIKDNWQTISTILVVVVVLIIIPKAASLVKS